MAEPTRRVEITFERELDALRGIADVFSNRRRGMKPAARSTERADGITSASESPVPILGNQNATRPSRTEPAAWLDDAVRPAARPAPVSRAGRYLATLNDAYGPIPPSEFARETPFVDLLVLDTSALDELARGSVRARGYVARALGSLCRIVVPATALATATHQRIADLVADTIVTDGAHARFGALLLASNPGMDPVDALRVATVSRAERAAIVTSRVETFERLVAATGRPNLYVFAL